MPSGVPKGTRHEPVICDPRLARELKRLRRKSHLTGEEVSERLGWSPSKVSRIERGRNGIRRSELEKLLRACDVAVADGKAVFALAAQLAISAAEFPGGHFAPAVRATGVSDWAPSVVPWLLQTQDYTEALLASRQPVMRLSPGQLADLTEAVIAWQAKLVDQTTLRAVISEAVLYQMVGSERVMRAQLEKIARPGGAEIQVRVLPQDRGSISGFDSFSYLDFAGVGGVGGTPLVMTYRLGSPVEVDNDKEIWMHKLVFTALWEAAEPPAAAVKQALADAWGG